MARPGSAVLSSDQSAAPKPPAALSKRVEIRKDKTNPRRFAYLILFLFAQPPGWPLFLLGAGLVLAAVSFHGWAAGYLARAGYEEREKILTVRGPYRRNRNPYYVAHLAMDFGFFCLAGMPWLYAVYFPVIFSVYRRWAVNEERFLEQEFGGDYLAFKRDVPRWRVRLTPAPARGREQRFEWRIFKLNKELPRALAHVIVLGAFGLYFFLGNPFADVESLVRATVVGAVVIWFLLHDIYPLDVSRVHVGWLVPAAAALIGGAAFLAVAPVWERWSGGWAWAAAISGLVLGLLVALAALPDTARRSGKRLDDMFAQPMCQWYAVGLALGLLSLTPGGVWVGILVPFVLWSVRLAGVARIAPVPQSRVVGLTLVIVLAAFAVRAFDRLS